MGRNAIYLDGFLETFDQGGLLFSGELSATQCSEYRGRGGWIEYDITFYGVRAFHSWDFELYPNRLQKVSSFDLVENSAWLKYLSEVNLKDSSVLELEHFVLSTYDFIYEIAASKYEFRVGKERA